MPNISFQKILKYNLQPKNQDIYVYLDGITSQKIDPPSLQPNTLKIENQIALVSTLKRSIKCINSTGIKVVQLNLLKEIPFSLAGLCSKEEWLDQKSNIVRNKFKKAFIQDCLMESRTQIFNEIEDLISSIKFLNQPATVVSHSFRLKVIQAYLETNGQIINEPQLIHNFILDEQKTFDFGKGFEFKI